MVNCILYEVGVAMKMEMKVVLADYTKCLLICFRARQQYHGTEFGSISIWNGTLKVGKCVNLSGGTIAPANVMFIALEQPCRAWSE